MKQKNLKEKNNDNKLENRKTKDNKLENGKLWREKTKTINLMRKKLKKEVLEARQKRQLTQNDQPYTDHTLK